MMVLIDIISLNTIIMMNIIKTQYNDYICDIAEDKNGYMGFQLQMD